MRAWIGCSLVILLGACSAATPSGFGSGDDSSGGGDDTSGGGDGSGGDGGAGAGKDGGGSAVVPPAPTQLLAGMDVTQINVYQATEVVVMQNAKAASHSTPVVAGRPALFRVFVKPDGYTGKVTAQLRFEDGSGKALDQISATANITAASSEGSPTSTINFDVPAADLVHGGKYSVALVDSSATDTAAGTASPARYPQDGTTDATTATDTGPLKVTLVPTIVSGGSAPDTSAAQLQILHDTMFAIYPVTDVTITVHSQMSAPYSVSATSSSGFENVLQWGTNLRETENPPDDVYYWITFDPKSTFSSFCGGGCIAGLSTVGSADDPSGRVSTGLGYTGSDTAFTMAHEVGHAHGRNHSLGCGAQGIDPSFPASYDANSPDFGQYATIGVMGYDIVAKQLIDPSTGDMMGYCPPTWVSDYTYKQLATRVATVNGALSMIGMPNKFATPMAHHFVNVDGAGNVTWGQPIMMRDKPPAGDHTVTYKDAHGSVLMTTTAVLHQYDHAAGGYLIVPEGPAGFASMEVSNLGSSRVAHTLAKTY